MKRSQWSDAAIGDLQSLRSYYSEDIARGIIERLVLATDVLLDWPQIGPEVAASGWRKWNPKRTTYILICRPVEDGIEISRVRHERENWLADL